MVVNGGGPLGFVVVGGVENWGGDGEVGVFGGCEGVVGACCGIVGNFGIGRLGDGEGNCGNGKLGADGK